MSVVIENLSFTYMPKTPYEKRALDGVTFTVPEGQIVGIVGATGSGKSTLIQHLNGIIKLTEGKIVVGEIDLSQKKVNLIELRKKIGMLFQYPEYQLFEDTVLKDVMFGCKNFGFSKEDAERSALDALWAVGLNAEEMKTRSPFELSGGEKRRAAIAGVIAYRPEILILDEPTGGLDPMGKAEILNLVVSLKRDFVKTILMISHNMDEIAEYTERVIVLDNGKLLADTTPQQLFQTRQIEQIGLGLPHTANIVLELKDRGISFAPEVKEAVLTKTLIDYFSAPNRSKREPKQADTCLEAAQDNKEISAQTAQTAQSTLTAQGGEGNTAQSISTVETTSTAQGGDGSFAQSTSTVETIPTAQSISTVETTPTAQGKEGSTEQSTPTAPTAQSTLTAQGGEGSTAQSISTVETTPTAQGGEGNTAQSTSTVETTPTAQGGEGKNG